MAHRFTALKSFSTKAVSVLASGALALSLTPAIALANTADLQVQSVDLTTQHYEYNLDGTKALIGQNGDPLNDGVKLVKKSGNTVQYMGYAHSDATMTSGGHYTGYSLYTTITTDDSGVITDIDLTSGNDTFAGKWGYYFAVHGDKVIDGYLPEGVDFSAISNSDGTYTPNLTGADGYGYKINYIMLISTNARGTGDVNDEGTAPAEEVYTGDQKKISTVKTTTTGEDADYYNLVQVNYLIGDENINFNTFFPAGSKGDAANAYLDVYLDENTSTWTEDATGGSGSYSTNRDRWTAVMANMSLRELLSWGESMKSQATGNLDGEIAQLDTVSGATKTSWPYVSALNQAKKDGYVKGVSEDVNITIDGAASDPLPAIQITGDGNHIDATTVEKGTDEKYVITSQLGGSGGSLELNGIYLYNLKGMNIGAQGMMQLAYEKGSESGEAFGSKLVKGYTPASEHLNETTSQSRNGAQTSYSWIPAPGEDTQAGEYSATVIDDDNVALQYDYTVARGTGGRTGTGMKATYTDCVATLKNNDVTHVVFTYTFGHEVAGIAYDLENMTKVDGVSKLLAAASSANASSVTAARSAYDTLPTDVRPFTTGIGKLHTAEAALVTAQLNGVSASSKSGVAAARSAYDELDAAAKAQVDSAAYSKLTAAESAIAAKTVTKGDTKTVSGQSYKVTKVANSKANGTVTFTKAKNAKSVTVPATVKLGDGKTYTVTKIAASSFAKSKATTVTVKATGLTKANVKNCFKGSKVKTVKVPAKKLAAYKKIFTKANTGSSKALAVKK